ncbi:MAG TPA: methylenetetrahydrofolate reductase [NAD(P)H] [Elusimicrobia bacterium]|nr:methylenetetrahydrofolate reductase [NAD(P)H] [Elusimicrobiota bacterium]
MRIPDLFRGGEPVFSFEFFLPKNESDLARFKETVRALKLLRPGFVTMTYGAGGSARERTIETAGAIKNELGLETAAHLTCVAHTPAEIAALLGRIRSFGIENIVALRGDLPKDLAPGAGPGPIPHAADLVRLIRSHGGSSVAVAAYPEKHPESPSPEEDLRRFREKTEAGADWAITQLFFDNASYFDFTARARAAGIAIPIVPGIMPVTNFKQLQKFTAMCGTRLPEPMLRDLAPIADDPEAVLRYGIDYAVRQCRELLQRGAPGIHFYTLNRSHATATILERLREGG